MSDVFTSLEKIHSKVLYSEVSGSGLPDVLDITVACQLCCGWTLNGSLSLISHSSFTMTPLFSWYYSTPGGSLWKSWPDKYGLRVLVSSQKNTWTCTHVTAKLAEFVSIMEMVLTPQTEPSKHNLLNRAYGKSLVYWILYSLYDFRYLIMKPLIWWKCI